MKRNIAFVLVGITLFLLMPAYHGPLEEAIHDQGGNVTISFALYFAAAIAASRHGFSRLAAATATLLAVEAFEAFNGFGVMANTYDPLDFLANAVGVGAAVVVDLASARRIGGNRTQGKAVS